MFRNYFINQKQFFMKGFIKLLPVAFGALIMASCSNNDLFDWNGSETAEYQLKDGEILVTVDENPDATRAAIGEAAKTENGVVSMYRSVFWREGDMIKVYDDVKWRPQYFNYKDNVDGNLDYIKNAAGALPAVFKLDAETSPSGTETTQYAKGYAVFPGKKFSVFQGEERDALTFDYTDMRYWDWDAVDTKYFSSTTPDGKSWRTIFPMWGNVDNSQLALKYLTGFLRIDLSGYKAIGAQTRASLVIQASKQLAGYYKAENFNYEAKRAPLLVGTSAEAGYADLAAIKAYGDNGNGTQTIHNPKSRTQLETDGKGDFTMVLNLDVDDLKANQGSMTQNLAKHNVFFIPVPVALKDYVTEVVNGRTYNKFQTNGLPDEGATLDPYAIRVSLVYDDGGADDDITINQKKYNAGGDVLFESESFAEIDKAGRFYNVDIIDAGVVNTPYQLGELIKNLDKIGRKVTVDLRTAPVVKGNETPQDQNLFIGQLNHDITINFPQGLEKSSVAGDHYDHTAAMYISKSGPGKLTLNFNGGTAANYPAIVIRDNGTDTGDYTVTKSSKVESDIVIDGTISLPLVVVETANNFVTLKAAANQVNLKGKMTIDALDKTIAKLDAKSDGSELALKNGTITELLTLYANNFTCNSEGKSFIKDILTPTSASENNDWEADNTVVAQWAKNSSAPYKDNYNNVTLNSTWDGVYYTGTDFTQQKDIHTAAQFSIGSYVAASALHTNMKIGTNTGATPAQKDWHGKSLTVDFDGLEKTVELLSTNATGNNGLFKDITLGAVGNVDNLNLKADIEPSVAVEKIGALAGTIDGTNATTIRNVKLLTGSKLGFFTSAANYTQAMGSKVGGLFGDAKGTVTVLASDVQGQIAGFASLGGYIGYAEAGAAITFGVQNRNASSFIDVFSNAHDIAAYGTPTSTVTFQETRTIPANLYNTGYGTIGMFVGQAQTNGAAAANITIENAQITETSPIKVNDQIKDNEATLLFNKNHYMVGYDANGNEKYYNYFGSTFNVIGYAAVAGAKQPVVKIGNGYWGSPADYQYYTLQDRKENGTGTVIEVQYYNWFKPWGE